MMFAHPMENSRFQDLQGSTTGNGERFLDQVEDVRVRRVQNKKETFVLVQINGGKEDVLDGVWEWEGELPTSVFLIPEDSIDEFLLGRRIDGVTFLFNDRFEEGDRLWVPTQFTPIVIGIDHHACSLEIVYDDLVQVFVFPSEGFKACFTRALQEKEPHRRPNHLPFQSSDSPSDLKLA